jgi:hypothetical protein
MPWHVVTKRPDFRTPEQAQVPVSRAAFALGQSAEHSWRSGFNRVTGVRPRHRRAIGSAGAAVLLLYEPVRALLPRSSRRSGPGVSCRNCKTPQKTRRDARGRCARVEELGQRSAR